METRKIKDAKDLSTDELIYFKGHAKATYMSNGSTVEDAINNISVGGGADLTGYATETYVNNVMSSKQDTINDLDTIRSGAALGATALQSETYKGTITGVSANGTSIATSGVADIPAASTSKYGVTKLSSATNSTSTTLAATASAVKVAYDLANGKQDKLVSGTNIKTINGTSILGSGNIVISGEGGNTYNVTGYPQESVTETSKGLLPNIFYVWGEVTSLNISFAEEESGYMNEYLFQFTSGVTPTTLTVPDNVEWVRGAPVIEANKTYQVSIVEKIGIIVGV